MLKPPFAPESRVVIMCSRGEADGSMKNGCAFESCTAAEFPADRLRGGWDEIGRLCGNTSFQLSAPRCTLRPRLAVFGQDRKSQSLLDAERKEAFEWMNSLQQGATPLSLLEKQLGQVGELKRLLTVIRDGRLSQRKRAIAALATERGIRNSLVSSFLHLSRKSG